MPESICHCGTLEDINALLPGQSHTDRRAVCSYSSLVYVELIQRAENTIAAKTIAVRSCRGKQVSVLHLYTCPRLPVSH